MNPEIDKKYMRRALQLARAGEGRVAPNPMVGAVIVAEERIIGEGFHAVYGGPHAEVNAVNSVLPEDRKLLKGSTIYVTLEPCSHYGKTPPCANLIIKEGIPRVVIGSSDPNPEVAGKGVARMREAGIDVIEGVLKDECDELNCRFMTYHKLHRPWVELKWAMSADGLMAVISENGETHPYKFSNSLSSVWMHRERANVMAIMVGKNTLRIDQPSLTVRQWGGKDPVRIDCAGQIDIPVLIRKLYEENIQSLMVEGGASLLQSFIKEGFYDRIRIEIAPIVLGKGLKAPALPDGLKIVSEESCRKNVIYTFSR